MEHYGIDKNIWVQDVQNRVFSTFGQPNWMASWLVAVIPLSIAFSTYSKGKIRETGGVDNKLPASKLNTHYFVSLIPKTLPIIFFIVLLFTKSRSGILGLVAADISFWILLFVLSLYQSSKRGAIIKGFLIYHLLFSIFASIIGTPWTKSISETIKARSQKTQTVTQTEAATTPLLELGGSSSTEIRKIVWQGALDVWKNYPLFGSGVETFAFSYYQFRPTSHNLVSEWDFLYNKAHNEYLNFMATTGTAGIASYLVAAIAIILTFIVINRKENGQMNILFFNLDFETCTWVVAMMSGFLSILITNFFGFSVVPVNLLFYLYPALAVILIRDDNEKEPVYSLQNISTSQKSGYIILSFFTLLLLIQISRYWYADILYNRAKGLESTGSLVGRVESLNSAIKLSPHEAIYYDGLASAFTDIALAYNNQNDSERALKYSENAFSAIQKAEDLSPKNLNIIRNRARIGIMLSDIKSSYILEAKKALLEGIDLAPTEAKLYYNLSLTYYRMNDIDMAVNTLEKTIDLKANYKDARYAYAIILLELGDKTEAKNQLNYILEKLDSRDANVKKALDEINL
jgi:tetratricopeptide (TPR) repeat protein